MKSFYYITKTFNIIKYLYFIIAIIIFCLLFLQILEISYYENLDYESFDHPIFIIEEIVAFILLPLRIIGFIFFLFWFYNAYKNLPIIEKKIIPRSSPKMAVAYFFIPILNLFQPLSSMKEIYNSSYFQEKKLNEIILTFWWILFVISTILARTFMRLDDNSIFFRYVELSISIFLLLVFLSELKIISTITFWQKSKYNSQNNLVNGVQNL